MCCRSTAKPSIFRRIYNRIFKRSSKTEQIKTVETVETVETVSEHSLHDDQSIKQTPYTRQHCLPDGRCLLHFDDLTIDNILTESIATQMQQTHQQTHQETSTMQTTFTPPPSRTSSDAYVYTNCHAAETDKTTWETHQETQMYTSCQTTETDGITRETYQTTIPSTATFTVCPVIETTVTHPNQTGASDIPQAPTAVSSETCQTNEIEATEFQDTTQTIRETCQTARSTTIESSQETTQIDHETCNMATQSDIPSFDANLDRLLGIYFDVLTDLKRSITDAQRSLTTCTSTITTVTQSIFQLEERFSEMSADVHIVETLIRPWQDVKAKYVV